MTDRDALADSVATARFPSVRLRQGYSVSDVDAFLDDLASAIRAGVPVRERVDAARFKQGWGGYDMGAVDDFLDRTADAADPGGEVREVPVPVVVADAPSAISSGDGAVGRALGILPVLATIATCGVVAGVVAVVVGNVAPGTSLPIWPTVLAGCVVGLVYGVAARASRARRS